MRLEPAAGVTLRREELGRIDRSPSSGRALRGGLFRQRASFWALRRSQITLERQQPLKPGKEAGSCCEVCRS